MAHISLTPFGRQPVTAGLLAARALANAALDLPGRNQLSVDKWSLFNDLRTARAAFGVTDRDLSVLYALLTFLPAKSLSVDAELVVFPSNSTLSDRAHGMAESTLRRHLAALVGAGLIWRQDSPNGKRYAARDRSGALVQAFGFDLRPLILRLDEIATAAEDAHRKTLELRRLREEVVLQLRDAAKLTAYGREAGGAGDWDAIESRLIPVRRTLRRNADYETLIMARNAAEQILAELRRILEMHTEKTDGIAAQNGRHHTNSNQDSSVFEPCHEKGRADGASLSEQDGRANSGLPNLPPHLVAKACPDLEPYARGDLATWHGLVVTAAFVRGMMGISVSAWEEAQRIMGPETAAVCVAAILQRIGSIANPGGYLRALVNKAANGGFSTGPMIMALLNAPETRAGKS
jgi:replication initiation protein RepC